MADNTNSFLYNSSYLKKRDEYEININELETEHKDMETTIDNYDESAVKKQNGNQQLSIDIKQLKGEIVTDKLNKDKLLRYISDSQIRYRYENNVIIFYTILNIFGVGGILYLSNSD